MYKLFVDSGAFSAERQNLEIDIYDYIHFIKSNIKNIDYYANLDIIKDAKATLENQEIMESEGLRPLPVYHVECDISYLDYYMSNYEYICFGNMVGKPQNKLLNLLNKYFSIICDNKGFPQIKVHGFGITSVALINKYPWYSVDSTSWTSFSRYGTILIPHLKNNKWKYNSFCWPLGVTQRSPFKSKKYKHYKNLTHNKKHIVDKYLEEKGYKIGKSEIVSVSHNYKPKQDEYWYEKGKSIEKIIEPGISNNNSLRNELNIIFYQDLAKTQPEWPWPFKHKKRKKFFL